MKQRTITDITYKYDEYTGKQIGKRVETITTPSAMSMSDNECEIGTGVLLEPIGDLSLFQTLLAVIVGGAFGVLTYKMCSKRGGAA